MPGTGFSGRCERFTPLAVLLRLGSRSTYLHNGIPSVNREGLGFEARVSIEGTLNTRREVCSTISPEGSRLIAWRRDGRLR